MTPEVRSLFERLGRDREFADRFFADPSPVIADMKIDPADAEALRHLDRDAIAYLQAAAEVEPELAPEHAESRPGNRYVTALVALVGAVVFVALWLAYRAHL